ncbi:nucleotidyl transferase AbiEii/AbiGii toxin family protein [Candidatus Woesebacteria bacterium]|nr:nucleotidyl transferase AbiEii/AbiGii toxin family protein [Candidatus Woesebacteria bacterium]
MGKVVLTVNQQKILGIISKDSFITTNFFITGGTALSGFYFHHRFSEDFDFFSEVKFDSKKVISSISKIGDQLRPKRIEHQNLTGQDTFYLYFDRKKFVKIDFSEFPFPHLGKFNKFNKLNIASIEDIAINKVHAITTRKRSRDYLDLYKCIKYLSWTNQDLAKNYRLKFDVILPPEQLATSFINVIDAKDSPIFLGKNNWGEVKSFFLDRAKGLESLLLRR